MSVDITPGSTVDVKVTRTPTNQRAAKTLSRIFAKAPAHRKARQLRKKLLAYTMDPRRRGGRIWRVRQKAPRLFQPVQGDACSVLATCDVIGDLRSVETFVEVSAAT